LADTPAWLNKILAAHPKEITFVAHFVPDGSHADLMLRAQGIGEVYTAIMVAGYGENEEEAGEAAAEEGEGSGDGDGA